MLHADREAGIPQEGVIFPSWGISEEAGPLSEGLPLEEIDVIGGAASRQQRRPYAFTSG